MGLLDMLLGRDAVPPPSRRPSTDAAPLADEQAIERYRYMLQTAPPQTLEQAHAEAFAKLTPEQRALLLQRLSAEMPVAERAAVGALKEDPTSLARLATRAEVRQPGTLERSFSGMGGMMTGSFLASMAGVVIGSAIAQSFFSEGGGEGGDFDAGHFDAGDAGGGDGDF